MWHPGLKGWWADRDTEEGSEVSGLTETRRRGQRPRLDVLLHAGALLLDPGCPSVRQ